MFFVVVMLERMSFSTFLMLKLEPALIVIFRNFKHCISYKAPPLQAYANPARINFYNAGFSMEGFHPKKWVLTVKGTNKPLLLLHSGIATNSQLTKAIELVSPFGGKVTYTKSIQCSVFAYDWYRLYALAEYVGGPGVFQNYGGRLQFSSTPGEWPTFLCLTCLMYFFRRRQVGCPTWPHVFKLFLTGQDFHHQQ